MWPRAGRWGMRVLALINSEPEALRWSWRHFARTPGGAGRPSAKLSLSGAGNSALQMENIFPEMTLPVERKYATD